MSILESAIEKIKPPTKLPDVVPVDIADKVRRGRVAMRKDQPLRRCCQKFFENEHYWFVSTKNTLQVMPNALLDPAKLPHRVRNTYNFAASIIEGKVSASTQKVPGYEITPSTDDPEDEAAASLSEQVAVFGYDKWRLRRHTTKAVTNALVQREGFVMPYFDPNVGPYTQGADGKWKGQGEIRLLNLSRGEVMWEPGVDFDDSRWHGVERAQLAADVRAIPGFVGGELTSDARTGDTPEGKTSDEMVVVTEYLERPCPKYPEGRRVFIANNRVIVDYRKCEDGLGEEYWWEPYPCEDANGDIADEPVLHRISYTVNPEGDDLGLMERLIDCTRTIDDTWNKIIEWKNRCLMPQMMAPRGSNVSPRNDIPGYVNYYNLVGGKPPEWERAMEPPQALFQILDKAEQTLRALAADVDVQPDPRLTTGTANAAIQQSQARWQSFLGDLAEFHSRLMRHCLCLVARHYDEQRQIDIRGQYGWQPLPAFTGQQLRSQVNVRVQPGSIESKSRESIQKEIEFIQANWPGAISAEAAMGALQGGSADGLIRSWRNQVARAWRVVRRLKNYTPELSAQFPTRFDPNVQDLATGQMGAEIPFWMPKEFDNIPIWRTVFGDFMSTEDFERRTEDVQHRFELAWQGLEAAEQQRAAKQAAQQQMQAASLGMGNAAKPGDQPPPLPDRAGFNPGDNQSAVPTA